ncbi:GDSL-type esterase/lipase family protein [Sphingobium phenoxybenzoativorans]|uniref:GDSL-type esterase/lipase family protein n=1 Tax=Sphingobium phenoxybenzoativorans TaxID=1592790 RepID=UPI000872E2A7|nr:GDSL-type esterase/lipase family protein [Sphingobium phenoxybenzoativorans]
MRQGNSQAGKAFTAICVFLIIIGGWAGYRYYAMQKLASAPLPDGGGRQGRCVLWFVGSSTINYWTSLAQDMAPWTTHNRGIAGAVFPQIIRHFEADEKVQPPEAIMLYAGENDIAKGSNADREIANLKAFLAVKDRKFPHTPLFFISTKPSPTRWASFAEQTRYNSAARALITARKDAAYVNIVPMLLTRGRPGNFYVADGVHLNPEGYRRVAGVIRGALESDLPVERVRQCLSEPLAGRD